MKILNMLRQNRILGIAVALLFVGIATNIAFSGGGGGSSSGGSSGGGSSVGGNVSGVSGTTVTNTAGGGVSVTNNATGDTTRYNDFNNDGDFNDPNEQSYAGGDGDDGGSSGGRSSSGRNSGKGSKGSGGGSTPTCNTNPDLRVENVTLTRFVGSTHSPTTALEPEVFYTPKVVVRNQSCRPTSAAGVVESPFSEVAGAYPIRLQLDLNNNGSIDVVQYLNNQPALNANQEWTATFPNRTFPIGTHRLIVYVDVPGTEDPGRGCSRSAGCVVETAQANNVLELVITVIEPMVELDVFYYESVASNGGPLNGWGATRRGDNDLALETDPRFTGSNFGLHWTQDVDPPLLSRGIIPSSCTGTGVNETGAALGDFNGKRSSAMKYVLFRDEYDHTLTAPPVGSYHVYSITCNTIHGGTVSDTIVVSNGVDTDTLLMMEPVVNNVYVKTNEILDELDFLITNTSPIAAPGTNYSITIEGIKEGSGVTSVAAAGDTPVTDTSIAWTAPNSAQDVRLRVCIDHPDLVTGQQCDDAWIFVVDSTPGIGIPPIIDITDPSGPNKVVRQGDEIELTWDPVDTSTRSCGLSSNVPGTPNANNSGTATFPANRTAEYTITCDDGLSDSVRIRVVPILFET